jgi:hypothetical protein
MSDLEDLASDRIFGVTNLLIERLNNFRFGKDKWLI